MTDRKEEKKTEKREKDPDEKTRKRKKSETTTTNQKWHAYGPGTKKAQKTEKGREKTRD